MVEHDCSHEVAALCRINSELGHSHSHDVPGRPPLCHACLLQLQSCTLSKSHRSVITDTEDGTTTYRNYGEGEQNNNTGSGNQIIHPVYHMYYQVLPRGHEANLPLLYEAIDSLSHQCLVTVTLLDPKSVTILPAGRSPPRGAFENRPGNTSGEYQEFATELRTAGSRLSSLKKQLEDLQSDSSGRDTGWQVHVSALAPSLRTCRDQMARYEDNNMSQSSNNIYNFENIPGIRELLRNTLMKVEIVVLIAPFLYSLTGSPNQPGQDLTEEEIQRLRLRLLCVLNEGLELTSTVEPTKMHFRDDILTADDSAQQQLHAVIEDDQRTIRAARLSIIGSIRSSSSLSSIAGLMDGQENESLSKQQLSRSRLREEIVLPGRFSRIERENAASAASQPSPGPSRLHRRYYSADDREQRLIQRPPESTSEIVLTLDDGAIWGLSQLTILQALMKALTKELKIRGHSRSTTIEPTELFDWIVGEGSGGLNAIMLCRFRMTIHECVSIYLNNPEFVLGKRGSTGYPLATFSGRSAVKYLSSILNPDIPSKAKTADREEIESDAESGKPAAKTVDAKNCFAKYAVTCRSLDSVGHSSGSPPTVLLCDKTFPLLDERGIMRENCDFGIDTLLELVCNSGTLTTRQIQGVRVAGTHRPNAKNPSFIFYHQFYLARSKSVKQPARFINIGTGFLPGRGQTSTSTLSPATSQPCVVCCAPQSSDSVSIQMKSISLDSERLLEFDRLSASKGQIHGPERDKTWKAEEVCERTARYLKCPCVVRSMAGLARVLADSYMSRVVPRDRQNQELEQPPKSDFWKFITRRQSSYHVFASKGAGKGLPRQSED